MLLMDQESAARTIMAAPTKTKQRVTPIESANIVEKMRPTGMAQLHTAPYRPKTRPKQSGSTLHCISAICGLLYNGDDTPIANVNARNGAKADAGSKPVASVVTPNRAIASTQKTPWCLKPPVAPIINRLIDDRSTMVPANTPSTAMGRKPATLTNDREPAEPVVSVTCLISPICKTELVRTENASPNQTRTHGTLPRSAIILMHIDFSF